MKNLLMKLLPGIFLFYIPLQSKAWGTQGHRICGQIAYSYLTLNAKKAVDGILGNESLALAGNWADFIKSDSTYNYLSTWHYIDFGKVYTYSEMVDYLNHDIKTDAYTKIVFLEKELRNKTISKQNKLLYLHLLVHIIEDIHQPMHTAHADDKGGNDLKVMWFNTPTNMHSVWDSNLIDFQQLSYTEYTAAINHTTMGQRTEWQKDPLSKWIYESNQIAEKIYAETRSGDVLNYKYNFKHIDTLNRQLLKAGVRLAGVLNQLFS